MAVMGPTAPGPTVGDGGNTSLVLYHDSDHSLSYLMVLKIIATVLGLLFNLVELMLIAFIPALRKFRVTTLVMSLGMADLVLAITMVASLFMEFEQLDAIDLKGVDICLIWGFLMVLGASASSYNTCGIAIDRYVSLITPITYSDLMTPRRISGLITVIWLLSIALATLLPFLYNYGGHVQSEEETSEKRLHSSDRADEDEDATFRCHILWINSYASITTSVIVFVPGIIIATLYIRLVSWARIQYYHSRDLARRNERIRNWEENTGQISVSRRETRNSFGHVTFGSVRFNTSEKGFSVISTYGGSQHREDWFLTSADEVIYTRMQKQENDDNSSQASALSAISSPTSKSFKSILATRTSQPAIEQVDRRQGILKPEKEKGGFAGDQYSVTRSKEKPVERKRHICCFLNSRKTKIALVLCYIIVMYIVLWLPFTSLLLLENFGVIKESLSLKQWTVWLAYTNCLINPLFFFVANVTYRQILSDSFIRRKHPRPRDSVYYNRYAPRRSSTQYGIRYC